MSYAGLGILSLLEGQAAYARRKDEMAARAGGLDIGERAFVAAYLRGGHVVLALMAYTTDIVGDRFGTSGGSGIRTDGTYYWRGDAADYVETYGVHPGETFVRHVHALGGEPPALTQAEILAVDDHLVRGRRPSPDA